MKVDENMKHIPVIMISTEGRSDRIQEIMSLGAAGYITKPFRPEDIRVVIQIKGNPNYLLTFVFDRVLAARMAEDILGIDESEVSTEIIQKCLKETANIYTGKFLLTFEHQQDKNITTSRLSEQLLTRMSPVTKLSSSIPMSSRSTSKCRAWTASRFSESS